MTEATRATLFAVGVLLVIPWIFRLDSPSLPSGADLPILGRVEAGWTLETLDGKEVSFRSFQGQAVLLNIWATWCPPCVAEIPSIQELHDALTDHERDPGAIVLVGHGFSLHRPRG